jgi:hypothetical protein
MSQFLAVLLRGGRSQAARAGGGAMGPESALYILDNFWDRRGTRSRHSPCRRSRCTSHASRTAAAGCTSTPDVAAMIEAVGLRIEKVSGTLGICSSLLVCREAEVQAKNAPSVPFGHATRPWPGKRSPATASLSRNVLGSQGTRRAPTRRRRSFRPDPPTAVPITAPPTAPPAARRPRSPGVRVVRLDLRRRLVLVVHWVSYREPITCEYASPAW